MAPREGAEGAGRAAPGAGGRRGRGWGRGRGAAPPRRHPAPPARSPPLAVGRRRSPWRGGAGSLGGAPVPSSSPCILSAPGARPPAGGRGLPGLQRRAAAPWFLSSLAESLPAVVSLGYSSWVEETALPVIPRLYSFPSGNLGLPISSASSFMKNTQRGLLSGVYVHTQDPNRRTLGHQSGAHELNHYTTSPSGSFTAECYWARDLPMNVFPTGIPMVAFQQVQKHDTPAFTPRYTVVYSSPWVPLVVACGTPPHRGSMSRAMSTPRIRTNETLGRLQRSARTQLLSHGASPLALTF
ncbi:uncharacterized protein [Equus asinus]|uniref:uncharacterized protein n=1 Tax=Equus asinus TaxID=9793 RepID=UPI0038F5D7E3